MPNFSYKIKRTIEKNEETKTKQLTGTIIAETREEAIERLMKIDNSIEIVSVRQRTLDLFNDDNLSQKELISFFSSLGSMDKVGLNILQSLEMMKDEVAESKKLKKVCEKIYFSVLNGDSLSVACKNASTSFTHDYIGLIEIAERTGKYSQIFDEIVEYTKWNYDVKVRTRKAIRGPLATLGFMCVMIILMSNFILPKIIEFTAYFGSETPFYTQILINFATFVKEKWMLLAGGFFATYVGLKMLSFANNDIAVNLDFLKLKIPLLGNLIPKTDTSRFITFFTIMYNNGADVLNTLDGISRIVSNRYIGRRVLVLRQSVLDGHTIFGSMNEEKMFPTMFRKMMAICEATGEVGAILNNVRFFYDTEVKDTTEKFVSTIKPTTTVILGVVVGWMAMAMMGPIYSNLGTIGNVTSSASTSGTGF